MFLDTFLGECNNIALVSNIMFFNLLVSQLPTDHVKISSAPYVMMQVMLFY